MKNKSLILAAFAIATLATGCNQSNPADKNPAPGDTNALSLTQQLQNAKAVATNAWQKVKDTTTNAWSNLKEGTTNAWADIKDSMQSTNDYTYDQKDAFIASARADLDALDQKIKEFSDKVAAANDSVKDEAKKTLQDLRDQRTELGKKLDDTEKSGQADWNELKAGFQTSYEQVKASLKQAWEWLNDKLSA